MAAYSSILDTNSYSGRYAELLSDKERKLIERREKYMSSGYRLFYRKPVYIVRGEGNYLWDDEGNKYLDMYNNVASVGHCNPAVVEAVNRQMRILNTHTRYLSDIIIDYSEALLHEMPEEVDKITYMCSGSEANDLALRVAEAYTGKKGIIVTREAYHGNTFLVSGVSPSLGEGQKLLDYAELVPTPDYYRHGGSADKFTNWFLKEMQEKIDTLKANGYGFSCFLADSIFSSDGVFPDPKGFLSKVADLVHKNGGVYIADEVQPGFCRTGDSFWGFMRHGVIPDIVTMGKPMANGIPCSGLAARHEVLAAFTDKLPYFNTFGGNPVSMAAASAVLKVIKEDNILEHVKVTGSHLLQALKDVQEKHPDSVGDVRGTGLFIGLELVSDAEEKTPDKKKALDLIEMLRDRHILTSVCGHDGNILKIRPTLKFADCDIDWFATALDECLTELKG